MYFNNTTAPTASTTTDTSGFGGGAMLIPALTSMLGVMGNVSAMKARTDAMISNMESSATSLKFSQYAKKQQLEDLNRVVGDKLSASGLEALKAEGRLKAAAAETGSYGTSVNDAIATADVNRLHRDAEILREADIAKANKLSELVSERLSFNNQLDSMVSGQPSTTGAFLSALNTSVGGLQTGLNFLNTSQKEKFFGINTTGETNG